MISALGKSAFSPVNTLSPLRKSDKQDQSLTTDISGASTITDITSQSQVTHPAQNLDSLQSLVIGTLSLDTFAALVDPQNQMTAQTQSPAETFQGLLPSLDKDGDGQLSKSELDSNLGGRPAYLKAIDNLLAQLDKDGNGSISGSEFEAYSDASSRGPLAAFTASSYQQVQQLFQREANAAAASVRV